MDIHIFQKQLIQQIITKQILEGIPGMTQNPYEFYEGNPEDSGLHYQRLQLVRSGHFTAGCYMKNPLSLIKDRGFFIYSWLTP
ncbi:hypothetical protein [Paenibacillus sp. FSL H8-0332]|uniref:hypothetical protein n=1 Tax=Paenibacillus sp. FSL H8-0332 TaxID=2954742 RepID=UPI0030D40B30